MFSFARSSSPARMLPAPTSCELGGDHVEALAEILLARADVDADLARRRRTATRRCRPSTPSLASRGSPGTAWRTPSRRGSRRAAPSIAARVVARRARARETDVVLLGVLALEPDRRAWERPAGLRSARERGRAAAVAVAAERGDDPLVVDVARRGQDDVRADVRAPVIAEQRAPRDRRDHLRAADHGPAERMRAEDGLGGEIVDDVLRVVLDHRDLLEHDLALRVDVGERGRKTMSVITSSATSTWSSGTRV